MQFDVHVCCRINIALIVLTHIVGRSSYRPLVARLGRIKARIATLCAQAPLQLLATMNCATFKNLMSMATIHHYIDDFTLGVGHPNHVMHILALCARVGQESEQLLLQYSKCNKQVLVERGLYHTSMNCVDCCRLW